MAPTDDTPRPSRRQERRDAYEQSQREIESWLAGPGAIVIALVAVAVVITFLVLAF